MSSTISFIVGTVVSGSSVLKTDGSAGAKSDTYGLASPAIGFHANAAGNIAFKDSDGNLVTATVTAGTSYPYRVAQVMSTNTTLTDAQIILLYGPGGK